MKAEDMPISAEHFAYSMEQLCRWLGRVRNIHYKLSEVGIGLTVS